MSEIDKIRARLANGGNIFRRQTVEVLLAEYDAQAARIRELEAEEAALRDTLEQANGFLDGALQLAEDTKRYLDTAITKGVAELQPGLIIDTEKAAIAFYRKLNKFRAIQSGLLKKEARP